MTITLNGKPKEFPAPLSVQGLLETLGLDAVRVAVEHNRNILPCDQFAGTFIDNGDTVEIIHFVGGGGKKGIQQWMN